MQELTTKQEAALAFCREWVRKNKRFPTIKEICTGIGASSTNTAAVYLKVLVKKGALIKDGRYHKLANQVDWRGELLNLAMCPTTNPGELMQKRQREALNLLEENPE